jgi:hypothetical protein
MERFNLDQLLRHAFAGAGFLITVLVAYPQLRSTYSGLDSSLLIATSGGAILLFGSLIYVLHRTILLRLSYSMLIRMVWKNEHRSQIDLDLGRFRRGKNPKSLQGEMVEWASQVHFLYCIAWAVIFGLLSGLPLFGHLGPRFGYRLATFTGVMLSAALYHNRRYLSYERETERRESKVTSIP